MLKKAILNAFQYNEEGFRQKFRTCVPLKDENFMTFMNRLRSFLDRWLELAGVNTTEVTSVLDFKDQIFQACHSDLIAYIRKEQPHDCNEVGLLAERFANAHPRKSLARAEPQPFVSNVGSIDRSRSSVRYTPQRRSMSEGNQRYCNSEFKTLASYNQNDSRVQGNCYRCGKPGHRAASCWTRLNVTQHQPVNNYNPMGHKTVPITCYTCGRQGHTSARCYKQGSKTDTTTRQSAGEKGKDS
ncbi:reverse transcriptase [Plakobranchus ocellatus]|uniref:Reverse transcriptase n=1 Tax=Plakobranchus ocellatus TaxID=259542 RepID=A0AAV4BWI7_9GAST|nr:reverse transcriptase [Plakobranchus ocellatus]